MFKQIHRIRRFAISFHSLIYGFRKYCLQVLRKRLTAIRIGIEYLGTEIPGIGKCILMNAD